VTTAEAANVLKTSGHGILKAAKRELELKGNVHPIFAVQDASGEVQTFPITDSKLADVLNDVGAAKDQLLRFFRVLIARQHAIGFIACTEAWFAASTKKGTEMDRAEFDRITKEPGFETALARGLVTRSECISVTIQTETEVTLLQQPFERFPKLQLISFGTLRQFSVPQAEFDGRQKMYGDLRKVLLPEEY
jgi:hypothetical protein